MVAGVAWIASFVVGLVSEGQGSETFGLPSFYLIEGLTGLALAGTLVGLLGLHARQDANYGVLGTVGFLAALVGTALVLANVLLIRTAERNLLDLLLLLGLLGMLLGFLLLGIATLRARVLPQWAGVGLRTPGGENLWLQGPGRTLIGSPKLRNHGGAFIRRCQLRPLALSPVALRRCS